MLDNIIEFAKDHVSTIVQLAAILFSIFKYLPKILLKTLHEDIEKSVHKAVDKNLTIFEDKVENIIQSKLLSFGLKNIQELENNLEQYQKSFEEKLLKLDCLNSSFIKELESDRADRAKFWSRVEKLEKQEIENKSILESLQSSVTNLTADMEKLKLLVERITNVERIFNSLSNLANIIPTYSLNQKLKSKSKSSKKVNTKELIKSGFAGLTKSGKIVDIRKYPNATPIKML